MFFPALMRGRTGRAEMAECDNFHDNEGDQNYFGYPFFLESLLCTTWKI